MMATPIDCRAYYIDTGCDVIVTSSQASCDTGSGFSVSKYLIDKSRTGVEKNSAESTNLECIVDNIARNRATNVVSSGSDVIRTSGRTRLRSVKGRLRRVMSRLESLVRDMKVSVHFTP